MAAFFSTDGSLSINGGAPAVGRGAIREVVQGFITAFPDLVLTMDDVRVEGDCAVYNWTFAGTNTGPGGTGEQVLFTGFEEWEIGAGGLIAGSLGHFDGADSSWSTELALPSDPRHRRLPGSNPDCWTDGLFALAIVCQSTKALLRLAGHVDSPRRSALSAQSAARHVSVA